MIVSIQADGFKWEFQKQDTYIMLLDDGSGFAVECCKGGKTVGVYLTVPNDISKEAFLTVCQQWLADYMDNN